MADGGLFLFPLRDLYSTLGVKHLKPLCTSHTRQRMHAAIIRFTDLQSCFFKEIRTTSCAWQTNIGGQPLIVFWGHALWDLNAGVWGVLHWMKHLRLNSMHRSCKSLFQPTPEGLTHPLKISGCSWRSGRIILTSVQFTGMFWLYRCALWPSFKCKREMRFYSLCRTWQMNVFKMSFFQMALHNKSPCHIFQTKVRWVTDLCCR